MSDEAFDQILQLAKIRSDAGENTSLIESGSDAMEVLRRFNSLYADRPPKKRAAKINKYLERGSNITKHLKSLLGAQCQICAWKGFEQKHEKRYIEGHHIIHRSAQEDGSLCTDNIVLLCPNCHREVHYGKDVSVSVNSDSIEIVLSSRKVLIPKNTMEHLDKIKDKLT